MLLYKTNKYAKKFQMSRGTLESNQAYMDDGLFKDTIDSMAEQVNASNINTSSLNQGQSTTSTVPKVPTIASPEVVAPATASATTGGITTANGTGGAAGTVNLVNNAGGASLDKGTKSSASLLGEAQAEKDTSVTFDTSKIEKGADGKLADPGAAAGTIGMQAGIQTTAKVGGMLLDEVDNGDLEYSDGEMAADIGKATLAGAAAGSVVPGIGTAIGAAAGLIMGTVTSVMKKKKMGKALAAANVEKEARRVEHKKGQNALKQQNKAATAKVRYSDSLGSNTAGYGNYYAYRTGGKLTSDFHFKIPSSEEELSLRLLDVSIPKKSIKIPIFKKGGPVKKVENVIPNGVLHAEKNDIGDRGMPVVKCAEDKSSCTKEYEIEKDELIFTLEATKNIEGHVAEDDMESLGKYVKDQLLGNTHSFTEKFEELNEYQYETIFA